MANMPITQLCHPAHSGGELAGNSQLAVYRQGSGHPAAQAARVVVTGANEVIRSGLCAMLAPLPEVAAVHERHDLRVAAELLASGAATVALAAPPLRYDDYGLITEAAARGSARTLVLLRDHETAEQDVIAQAVSLPADGYLLESGLTSESLADTLRQLGQGQSPMPTMLARGLVSRLRASESRQPGRPFLLTAREETVLSLMVDGQSNKEIARRLKISEHSAKRHVACVLAKLNCSNRTAAVALFLQQVTANGGGS